jgi:SAM-dependent methyltransferase
MTEISSAKLSIRPELLPGASGRVLDVGCGDGRHLVEAMRRGCRAVGVDYDEGAAAAARRVSGADVLIADAASLPFRNGAFDALVCTETLEHLPNDDAALDEIARVLAIGGVLLGAVPSHFTEMLYWRLSRGYRNAPGGHVRIYRPRALAATAARAGLYFQDVRYVHFVDSLMWLRFCLTDFLRPRRSATPYEQAIALAVAAEAPVASWRRRLRAAMARSRFIAGVDAAGALVWPKSLAFVARKTGARSTKLQRERRTAPVMMADDTRTPVPSAEVEP